MIIAVGKVSSRRIPHHALVNEFISAIKRPPGMIKGIEGQAHRLLLNP